jgi:hypothetical protein
MTSMQNNLLVETIENLGTEIRERHTTINYRAMNLNTVRKQNHERKASHQRMEKQLLRIGSSQAQARSNDTTAPATQPDGMAYSTSTETTL